MFMLVFVFAVRTPKTVTTLSLEAQKASMTNRRSTSRLSPATPSTPGEGRPSTSGSRAPPPTALRFSPSGNLIGSESRAAASEVAALPDLPSDVWSMGCFFCIRMSIPLLRGPTFVFVQRSSAPPSIHCVTMSRYLGHRRLFFRVVAIVDTLCDMLCCAVPFSPRCVGRHPRTEFGRPQRTSP